MSRGLLKGKPAGTLATIMLSLGVIADAAVGEAVFGFSGWSVGYLPTAIAIDRLNEMGYEIEAVELGGNSNQLLAAATRDIDITAIAQIMDAIDQGLDSQFFQAANTNEFVMVARAGYDTCAALDGRPVGISSVSSFDGQLAIQWFANACPRAEPRMMLVEGSENRLAGLLAGQIDASPIDLQDWTLLDLERPGDFMVVEDLTESMPILRVAFAAPKSFIADNEQLIEDWIRVHLQVYREIYEDPQILVDAGIELLRQIDPAALPAIVDSFVEAAVWPVEGNLTDESVQATIDFFNNDGEPFEHISAPADVVNRTMLDAVLAGQQQRSPAAR
jgi:ABC-type nitrate/sulfonate/bicarbonate transport system substrate-binding protein